jgi:phosphonate transport system ATP-binding protein
MALLELRNVTKSYNGGAPALDGVSLSIDQGEFVSIIGPSGSGKTTLLRCINRMIDVSSGEIAFAGVVISRLGKSALRSVRTTIGMIFQHHNLVDRLTVIENVLHGRLGHKSTMAGVLGRYTQEEKRRARQILALLGLEPQMHERCDQLSGGQKQRVGIARALVQNPQMILCDEPIASLDPGTAKIIMDHLRRICAEWGITLVLSLHQVDVALRYSHRIVGVKRGAVRFNGPPDQLSPAQIAEIYDFESREQLIKLEEHCHPALSSDQCPAPFAF